VIKPQFRVATGLVATAILILGLIVSAGRGWTQGVTPQGSPPSAESLTIAFHRDDGSLTPYTFEYGYPLMTLAYDTLMWRDKEGEPQPWLASSLESNQNFTQFTVKLADAKWHDGRPVTSSDVAFSFRLFRERFHPRFTPQIEPVERVDAPDEKTAVFRLRSPRPGFADLPLADVPIVPKHVWENLQGTDLPPSPLIGSGPYRLTSYTRGEGYHFEAFEEYFRGTPKVRVLDVTVIDTTEERLQAIERRRIDMTPAVFPSTAATRVRDLGPQYENPALR
jgi:peptide/nickel transport system substrate-binding protein